MSGRGYGPFFEEVDDEIDTSFAEPDFTGHVEIDVVNIRFHYFRCEISDEVFSERIGFAISHTRLNGISNLNNRSREDKAQERHFSWGRGMCYLENRRLRFEKDHFLAFVQGWDSRSSLSSGNVFSGIAFAMTWRKRFPQGISTGSDCNCCGNSN